MKRILISGYGRMGILLAEMLAEKVSCELAVYDPYLKDGDIPDTIVKLRHTADAEAFNPDVLLNCTGPESTVQAFDQLKPYLSDACLFTDIASVKNKLPEYYATEGVRFVSLHPMFGPTFASTANMKGLNCIIITESAEEGKEFFSAFFRRFGINVAEFSFSDHDKLMSKVLAVPFVATLLFAAVSEAELPGGTTYKRHIEIAEGLFSENPAVIAGILANGHNAGQVRKMMDRLKVLLPLLENQDPAAIEAYLSDCADSFRDKKDS